MTITQEKPIRLAADLYFDAPVLSDGSLWSHAATMGTRIQRSTFTIDQSVIDNMISVFKTGYPQKIVVDYEHGTANGATDHGQPVPAAGQVMELKGVYSASDFTGDLKAAAEKMAAKVGRTLDDPRNFGLWMRWRPTARALQMVTAREYTELSICFGHDIEHNVTGEGQGPGIISVALTNTPFLDDMLPVAASRSGGGSPADPGEEHRNMSTSNTMLQRAAAFFRKPLATEDAVMDAAEGEISTLRRENETLQGFKSFSDVVSQEIGETDPAKATAKVRELKAIATTAREEKDAATDRANASAADAILLKHEKRLTVPLKEHFKPLIMVELKAGVKSGETKTEKVIESLPENKNLQRVSKNDGGENIATDTDTLVYDRAKALMKEDDEIKELAKTNRGEAYKQAVRQAARELMVSAK